MVQVQSSLQDQVLHEREALAKSYARVVTEMFANAASAVEASTQIAAIRAPIDPSQIKPELKGIPLDMDLDRRAAMVTFQKSYPRLGTMYAIAPNGQLYATMLPESQATYTNPDLAGRDYFKWAAQSGLTSFSYILIAQTVSKAPFMSIGTPIKDGNGALISVLVGTINLADLPKIADSLKPGETGQVMLFDQKGSPIVFPDPEKLAANKPLTDFPPLAAGLAGQFGTIEFKNPYLDVDELGAVIFVPDVKMYAVVTRSRDEALAGVNRLTY